MHTTDMTLTVTDSLLVGDPAKIARRPDFCVRLDRCAGTWNVELTLTDDGHVAELTLTRPGRTVALLADEELAGQIAVDCGMVVVGPAAVAADWSFGAFLDDTDVEYEMGAHDPGYRGVIVCPSGFGDGTYPVWITCDDLEQPARISVEFIAQEH